MQSKGKLGSIVAGVIAVFLALVCLFYLSFTFISSKYENQAAAFATAESGNNDEGRPDRLRIRSRPRRCRQNGRKPSERRLCKLVH